MKLKTCYALVIGIKAYDNLYYSKLKNSENDARAVAQALSDLKFDVDLFLDITYQEFNQIFESYQDKIFVYHPDVALFYFAGHGMIIDNKNCLILKDTPPFEYSESKPLHPSITKQSIVVEDLTTELCAIGNQINILVLDACRTIPSTKDRGYLSSPGTFVQNNFHIPYQTFIAYSTTKGATASDGSEHSGNSLYTQLLLEHIFDENLPIELLFKKVRNGMCKDSYGNQQRPWEYSCLSEDFCFNYGQLSPYFEKIYSREAYEDSQYTTSTVVRGLIEEFKSYDYAVQNAAVLHLKNVIKGIRDKNDLFVLGRNLLQSADGGAGDCINEISYSNLLRYNGSQGGNHILNGILYEMYFDHNNTFREYPKGMILLDKLALIIENEAFQESRKFIMLSLSDYESRLIYKMGTKQVVSFYITLNESSEDIFGDRYWNISSIRVNDNDVKDRIQDFNDVVYEDLIDCLKNSLGIPRKYIQIHFSKPVNNTDKFNLQGELMNLW